MMAERLRIATQKPSQVVPRAIKVNGRKTAVSLEDAFWNALKEIAALKKTSVARLVSSIDIECDGGNLSSALRLFVLRYYRD
jgi:predicted DNA-binding ribbon-helix-helix protein